MNLSVAFMKIDQLILWLSLQEVASLNSGTRYKTLKVLVALLFASDLVRNDQK